MIYLDYSATTPVNKDVLNSYIKATNDYIGNANSIHALGVQSKVLLNSATKQIADLLGISEEEVIITSGATESNNTALKGIALSYQKFGKHIITSEMEHPSIYKICEFLETQGFEISYVKTSPEGIVDFEDLKRLIRKDTILVSICAVNSEIGTREPLKTLRQIIHKENPNTIFHSDITQAIGKVPINFHDIDLASFSGHKIYAPKGIGVLYKAKDIHMTPLIHGTTKYNDLRSGTPALPLIVSLSKALRIALSDLENREQKVSELNKKLVTFFKKFPDIKINQTSYSIPHILNISLMNIRPETFVHALEDEEIYVSTNTACSSGNMSTAVMSLYNDKQRSLHTLRISLSYYTTNDEIDEFMRVFEEKYNDLNTLTLPKKKED